MTKIKAKIIADSKNEFGNRITTMVLTFPRFILAEFNTHRIFSRNSASSRAIPFRKMVDSISANPFIPIAWQKEHPGMQGTEYITDPDTLEEINRNWLQAKSNAVDSAMAISHLKGTKQLVNRLLEPFMWHNVIVTATEWENFFALRCPSYDISQITLTTNDGSAFRSKKDTIKYDARLSAKTDLDWLLANKGQAEIHMMALAEAMWDAYNESTPKELKAGEWHVPFEHSISRLEVANDINHINTIKRVKLATVMCARVSYTVVGEDKKPLTYQRMIELHDEMANANPKHMSPFEHCARAMNSIEFDQYICGKTNIEVVNNDGHGNLSVAINLDETKSNGWSANLRGFIQYRKMFANENITK